MQGRREKPQGWDGTVADLDSPPDKFLNAGEVPNINGDSECLTAAFLDLALDGTDGGGRRIGIWWERCIQGVGIAGGFGGYDD